MTIVLAALIVGASQKPPNVRIPHSPAGGLGSLDIGQRAALASYLNQESRESGDHPHPLSPSLKDFGNEIFTYRLDHHSTLLFLPQFGRKNPWILLSKGAKGWQLEVLPVTSASINIRSALCKDFLGPVQGFPITLYVNDASSIRRVFNAPGVEVEPFEKEPISDVIHGPNLPAYVVADFGKVSWLTKSTGFVSFSLLRHPNHNDVTYALNETRMVRFIHGHWSSVDIGILPTGE